MNMSYCRFQNTAIDLQDCLDNIVDVLSKDEHNARKRLIKFARNIVIADEAGDIPSDPAD